MSDFGAKKLTRCSRVLVVTELVLSKCYVSQASKGPKDHESQTVAKKD